MWNQLFAQEAADNGTRQLIDNLARTPLSKVVLFVAICTVIRLAIYGYLKNTPPHRRSGGYGVARILNEAMDAVIYAGVFVFLIIRPFFVQAFLIPSASMVNTLLINDFIVANKAIYRYTEPKFQDIAVFKPPAAALNKGEEDMDFIKRVIGTPGHVIEVRNNKLYRDNKEVKEPYLPEPMMSAGDWKLVHYEGSYEPWKGKYIPVVVRQTPSGPLVNYETVTAREYAAGLDPSVPGTTSMPDNRRGEWKSEDQLSPQDLQLMQELSAAPPAAVPNGYLLMFGDNRNGSYDSRAWGLVPRSSIIGRSEAVWFPISRWKITR